MTVRAKVGHLLSWIFGRVFERPGLRTALLHGLPLPAKTALAVEVATGYELDDERFLREVAAEPREKLARALGTSIDRERRTGEALVEGLSHAARCWLALDGTRGLPPDLRADLFESLRGELESNEKSLPYALMIYGRLHGWLEQHAGGVAGKRILELGPGHSLAPAAFLVAAGLERWVGADLFPIARADPEYYRKIRAALAADRALVRPTGWYAARERMLARFDEAVKIGDASVTFDTRRIDWRSPVDAAALPFEDGSFDVCVSNATLEHVRDPATVVRESVRVLAPGGVGIHQIDLRDHRDFSRPLEFLRYTADQWSALFDESGKTPLLPELGARRSAFQYTNRWRRSEFLAAFEKTGVEVLGSAANISAPLADATRASLHASFKDRAREDLEALSVFFVVRKPARVAVTAS